MELEEESDLEIDQLLLETGSSDESLQANAGHYVHYGAVESEMGIGDEARRLIRHTENLESDANRSNMDFCTVFEGVSSPTLEVSFELNRSLGPPGMNSGSSESVIGN